MRARLFPWEIRAVFPALRTLPWVVAFLVAAASLARVGRAEDVRAAADSGLEIAFGILLPLLTAAAVLHLAGGANLRELGAAAARHGTNRRARVVRALVAVTAGLAGVALLLALVTLPAARGLGDLRLLADLVATVPVALAAAVAYVPWLAAGACFGSRGAGALVVLLVDWLAGATSLPIALATPRGHIRYLLGLESAFSFAPWLSFLALLGLGALGLLVVALRTPR